MKKLVLIGYAALLGALVYRWIEVDSLCIHLKQSSDALQLANHETEEVRAQLDENKLLLETAQSRLQEIHVQLAQARSATSDTPPPKASAVAATKETSGSASFSENVVSLAKKASRLDRALKEFPALDIPEIDLLNEADWIKAVVDHPKFETHDQVRDALKSLAFNAKLRALDVFSSTINFKTSTTDAPPIESLDPLLPELRQKMSEEILQRYEILPAARLEAGWLDLPAVKSCLLDAKQAPSIVVREKNPMGEDQAVIIFFATPQTQKEGEVLTSSIRFFLPQKNPPE